ncbi:MAG: hypothetical protein AB1416_00785 [Actinomycetota bacterium]
MADPVRALLEEYRARFLAGEEPDARDFIERAGARGPELADLLDGFLRTAPAADPTPEDVALVRAIGEGEPSLLAQRTARGVRRGAIVDALMTRFGFAKASRSAVADRYHELESGLLDPRRVDPGVLDAVAAALGVARGQLSFGRPRPPAAAAYLRVGPGADLSAFDVAAPRAAAPPAPASKGAPPGDLAEIDRLFGVGS